jgi:hypothetical protein
VLVSVGIGGPILLHILISRHPRVVAMLRRFLVVLLLFGSERVSVIAIVTTF